MKNKVSVKKYILKYGILYGITSTSFSYLTYLSEYYTKQNLFHGTILFLITLSYTLIGIFFFKKNNNNLISIKESLKIGLGISIIASLIIALFKIILIKIIDPDIILQFDDKQFERIAKTSGDFSKENIEKKVAITKTYTSSMVILGMTIIENLFIGFLLSLIIGLIIRKKKKESLT